MKPDAAGSSSRRKAGVAVALAVLAGAAVLAWHTLARDRASVALTPAPVAALVDAPRAPAPEPASEAAPRASERDALPDSAPPPTDLAPDATAPAETEAGPRASVFARFVDPLDRKLVVSGRLELLADDQAAIVAEVRGASETLVPDVPAGSYRLRVHADGLRHREQRLEITEEWIAAALDRAREEAPPPRFGGRFAPASFGESDVDPLVHEIEIVLWPEGWVSVLVRTREGEPFRALADALGLAPGELFVEGFDVRVSREPPLADAWSAPPPEPPPARFHLPPGYQSWELGEACIGSLELVDEPPVWVGLSVLGTPLGWELLAPDAREITFLLDLDELVARTATLALRVVELGTGAPLPQAEITLKADTSAHRRDDHLEARPDEQGNVLLRHIVSGRYELVVATESAMHQERIDVPPAAHIDKGEIALASGGGVVVRVEGAGEGTIVFVETAPYAPGQPADALYSPNLWRTADEKGEVVLPVPTVRTLVRATIVVYGGAFGGHESGARSPDVLLDPESLPAGPLVLVVHEPTRVAVGAAPSGTAKVEWIDEDIAGAATGLAVDVSEVHEGEETDLDLIPGRYRARALDAEGAELASTSFTVGREPVSVVIP